MHCLSHCLFLIVHRQIGLLRPVGGSRERDPDPADRGRDPVRCDGQVLKQTAAPQGKGGLSCSETLPFFSRRFGANVIATPPCSKHGRSYNACYNVMAPFTSGCGSIRGRIGAIQFEVTPGPHASQYVFVSNSEPGGCVQQQHAKPPRPGGRSIRATNPFKVRSTGDMCGILKR